LFWVPIYRISALLRFMTGLVSIATVLALIKYFNDAVGLRTSQEYERELQYRQKALQALERSNEELKQFAYVASHDLQSPLKTIEGYLGLLESRYNTQLDETGVKILRTTARSAGRMRLLINDLLEFSQAGLSQDAADTDLNDTLKEALEEMQSELDTSGTILRMEPLPQLRVSNTEIKRVFQNLIANAIRYSRKGIPPEIEIWAREKPDEWLFCVSDNGIGIEEAYFSKIFLVFQRLHGREAYPGTGIGLSTCKKIIETHGGKIWLNSTPGKGSDFYFTLPKNLVTIHDYAS